jgi:DNA-binding FadR family transcriptional regulator
LTDGPAQVPVDDKGLHYFRPIRQRKAADEVVAVIVDAIRAGLYEPGDRLPKERDLAERLEVSRTTLREGIGLLERAGVLTVRRGQSGGAVVTRRAVPASLVGDREAFHPSTVRSLLQVRRMLETGAAVATSQRATNEDFAELGLLVEALRRLTDTPEEFIEVDFQFHLKIAEMCGNLMIHEFLQSTFRKLGVIRSQYPVGHVDLESGIRNQVHTLAALESRDVKRVLRSVDSHLGQVEEHFLGERLPAWRV